ncbi:MAG: hypothetical protein PUA64_06895 [Treponema sp.]|nr:hypothetical protein [Treponema sp.]
MTGACTLNICFYKGQNNASVTLNGNSIITSTDATDANYATKYEYPLTGEGEVIITSTANGYIGYFEVVY